MNTKKKVLIVDDDEMFVTLLSNRLEDYFEIETALNGEEFAHKAFLWRPDLIILDILLADENGAEVHDQLLSSGFNPEIPILFISTLVEDASPVKLSNGRRIALLSKKFSPEELFKNIEILIGS